MPDDLTPNNPVRFGLTRFADLLPARDPIIGEDLGSFDGFRDAMMQSLAPITPYEGVIAENLISIEWELIQHRRLRNAGLRNFIRDRICEAVVAREEAAHEAALDEAFDKHEEVGGTQDDWKEPFSLDQEAAKTKGRALAASAVSRDPCEFSVACEEIEAMGLDVVDLMGEAYRTSDRSVVIHENKLKGLESRRREVKRDFDALQKTRPIEAEIIEG